MPYLNRNNALAGKSARGLIKDICTKLSARVVTVACLILAAMPIFSVSATEAAAETRSLKLYYIHTKEKAVITFKRNGKYDQKGLQELNRFLRDWRRNQPTKMDPRLFDLVWEVYRRSGATEYINVVSAFRSPETNGMLRSRTKGVAKHSQHTLGKAMDFFIPGVKLARLREIGMQMQIGGVGFYPTSGSPFVHMDVGNVRAWPRMSRQELVRIFPNGNTIHLPADGKPLPGYDQALADYKKRVSSSSIQVASTAGSGPATSSSGGKRKTLLAALFGGGDEDEDSEEIATPAAPAGRSPAPAPVAEEAEEAPVAVASAAPVPSAVNAPLPTARPAFRGEEASTGLATALYSPGRNAAQDALQAATTPTPTAAPAEQKFADLAEVSVPVPTLLGPRGMRGDAQGSVMTASLDSENAPADALLAHVPVPANRPAVAEALLASANTDIEGQDDEADSQASLSPTVIAALEQSGQDARSAVTAAAMPSAAPFPSSVAAYAAPTPVEAPRQVAKLDPMATPKAETFGDEFDPKPAASSTSGLTAGLPTKGGRPSKQDAVVSQQAMVSGGRLTQEAISDWALSQNKGATVRAVKAPRVSNRMLSHDMSASAANATFRQGAKAIDSSRFSSPIRMP